MIPTITIAHYAIDPKALLLIAAFVPWILSVLTAMFRRTRNGKRPVGPDVAVVFTSLLVFGAWYMQFEQPRAADDAATTTAVAAAPPGACDSIRTGMKIPDVESRLGKPDRVESEDEVRGPGAQVYLYDGSQCSVHLITDTVEWAD